MTQLADNTFSAAIASRPPMLVIEPASRWAALDLRDVLRYRDLLWTLAGRDVRLRYRQTALGVAWVIFQPLLASGILTLVFAYIAKMHTNFLQVFAGMLGWTVFNSTLTKSSASLVGNAPLISKVYFPRLILPLSTVLSTMLDFAVGLALMIILLIAYRTSPGFRILVLPVWLVAMTGMAVGVGLITAALSVTYRDVQYVIPIFMQLLVLASPVGYPASAVDPRLRVYVLLNPLAGLLEGFRWSLLGAGPMPWAAAGYSIVATVALLVIGALVFKRMERRFADVL